jgi:lipid A 3-O-deacylase
VCALLIPASLAIARGSESREDEGPAAKPFPTQLFSQGRFETSLISGVMFSPFVYNHPRPTINYMLTGLQLGYMLGDTKGDGWWRGNFELAGEAFGSLVYDGPGDFIAGGTVWLRYNFVPRALPRWVPYVQGGVGAESTDITHDIVGQPFNFNLDLAIGLRYLITSNWALSLEYRYQHISNANMGEHNLGINADGPILGISYFF